MPVDGGDITSRFTRWRKATLAPFEHRAFALFWWASLASSFGSMIQTVGASLAARKAGSEAKIS